MPFEFREYRAQDSDAVRDLLNIVFSSAHMPAETWSRWTASDFTAPVAFADGRPVGAIPLRRRTYRVAPDAEVVAWVEHRVGVAEALRDQGLGSGMQTCAKEFLRGRGDVLLVYRGGERSDGYRYYERNGLLDVAYPRLLRLEPTRISPQGTRWLDADGFMARDAAWLGIFTDCYGAFGGYPKRRPGYLRDTVESIIWREAIRHEFAYCVAEEDGEAVGYLVVGRRKDAMHVMELAVRGGSVGRAKRLLDAARGQGAPVLCYASPASLAAEAFRELGAPCPPRESAAMMLMIHVLDVESTGRKVWRDVAALRDVEVRAWTPLREGVLHRPATPRRTLTLELKEHTLSRLLMRRLDAAAAIRGECITLCGGLPGDTEALAEALPPCPWVYHHIDYL